MISFWFDEHVAFPSAQAGDPTWAVDAAVACVSQASASVEAAAALGGLGHVQGWEP